VSLEVSPLKRVHINFSFVRFLSLFRKNKK
jgi:hypothetical protein